jgi:O-antigen/teichoic acid export membrane protein
MHDLGRKAVKGGVAKVAGQGATLFLKVLFLAVMARLLGPNDFGLVAMATAITGVYDLFTSAGLSSATVQQIEISNQQVSQLFWVNILVGCALAMLCAGSAPAIATFYHDPRLFWIVLIMAPGFLLNAAGVQHSALLQRQLRYVTISLIDTVSQAGSTLIGIGLAWTGLGYWSLVAALLLVPAINTAGCWLASGWVPGRPRRGIEIRPLLRFGGTITLNSLVVYIGYNTEKVLLGRFWGPDALGLYTRAVQLINLPVSSINSAVGGVFFSVLSRLQGDPERFRAFFLKGYALVMSVTIPTTLFCALFATEIVAVVLGPKWADAAILFRLMTPTILVLGIINPLAWILLPIGLQKRSLQIGLVLAPLVLASYSFGIPYGPRGVALCYSTAMVLWAFPHVLWCLHGTPVSVRDLAGTIAAPFGASILAILCAFALRHNLGDGIAPWQQLCYGAATMILVYGTTLLSLAGPRELYVNVLLSFKRPTGVGA